MTVVMVPTAGWMSQPKSGSKALIGTSQNPLLKSKVPSLYWQSAALVAVLSKLQARSSLQPVVAASTVMVPTMPLAAWLPMLQS